MPAYTQISLEYIVYKLLLQILLMSLRRCLQISLHSKWFKGFVFSLLWWFFAQDCIPASLNTAEGKLLRGVVEMTLSNTEMIRCLNNLGSNGLKTFTTLGPPESFHTTSKDVILLSEVNNPSPLETVRGHENCMLGILTMTTQNKTLCSNDHIQRYAEQLRIETDLSCARGNVN